MRWKHESGQGKTDTANLLGKRWPETDRRGEGSHMRALLLAFLGFLRVQAFSPPTWQAIYLRGFHEGTHPNLRKSK